MLIAVDANSGVPVFRQLMDQIRFHVASGLLRPGDELPSTRSLSQQLGVNPMTISKAYSLLEQEGIVERRPGLPLVVRRLGAAAEGRSREREMRAVLQPAVLAARQLGLPPSKASALFRRMLGEDDDATE